MHYIWSLSDQTIMFFNFRIYSTINHGTLHEWECSWQSFKINCIQGHSKLAAHSGKHVESKILKHFNSLAPGRFQFNFRSVIFKLTIVNGGWGTLWNCPQMNGTRPYWWWVNIGSGNGLVLSGTKPLPDPMLTQFYVTIWRHQTTMS